MSSQLQANLPLAAKYVIIATAVVPFFMVYRDYWSWMDGSVDPVPAQYLGTNEALTVTVAFFGTDGGWFGAEAMPRLGGKCKRRGIDEIACFYFFIDDSSNRLHLEISSCVVY
jgi:hypothetical protein